MKISTDFDPRNIQSGTSEVLITDASAVNMVTLGFANDRRGTNMTHIVCTVGLEAAHALLNDKISAYVYSCRQELDCDARIEYIVGGDIVWTTELCGDQPSYTMGFKIYRGNASAKQLVDIMKYDMVPHGRAVTVVEPTVVYDIGYAIHIIQ